MLAHTAIAAFPNQLLLIFGFASLLFAAFSLLRQRKLKRLFAYSSMEHLALISIAFGIATPLAYVAGLLHIAMHSLSKTAVFYSCGNIIQRFHTQTLSQLKGLTSTVPLHAWCLLLSSFILLGLPPSGLFFSELFLILAVLHSMAWLLIPLVIGLTIAFIAIFSKMQHLAFSTHSTAYQPLKDTRQLAWPVMLHLGIVTLCGLWIPLWFIQPIVHLLVQGI